MRRQSELQRERDRQRERQRERQRSEINIVNRKIKEKEEERQQNYFLIKHYIKTRYNNLSAFGIHRIIVIVIIDFYNITIS